MSSRASAEFDRYASTYAEQHESSIALSGEEPEYFSQYKIDDLARVCELTRLAPARILDFGAGIGNSLAPMQRAFPDAQISGIDVSAESLEVCRTVAREGTDLRCYDGRTIPSSPPACFTTSRLRSTSPCCGKYGACSGPRAASCSTSTIRGTR